MKSFDILRKLKRGWTQESWVICVNPVKVLNKEIFLHTLFVNGSPLKKSIYQKYEDYDLGEYGTFVNKYNGVNMFSGSLIVFGYNFSSTTAKYHPNDIGVENGILRRDGDERLYIACVGDYLFSLKKGDHTVYCTKKGSDEDITSWGDFDEFFVYVYKSLLKLYDEKGVKLCPQKSKFPTFANRTTDFNEIMTAHELVVEEEKELGISEEPEEQVDEDDEFIDETQTEQPITDETETDENDEFTQDGVGETDENE